MNVRRLASTASAMALVLALSACQEARDTTSETAKEVRTSVSEAMATAREEVRKELANENISLDARGFGLAGAHITPQGDLVIDGKTIATTAEQKKMLLDYRSKIAGIAEAGVEAGTQGAELAGKAATEAIGAIFNGKSGEQVKQEIEREAGKIAASAGKICELLPGLLDTQRKLAEALPEFRPYARMDQKDVDDCRVDVGPVQADLQVSGGEDDLAAEAAKDAQDAAGTQGAQAVEK